MKFCGKFYKIYRKGLINFNKNFDKFKFILVKFAEYLNQKTFEE